MDFAVGAKSCAARGLPPAPRGKGFRAPAPTTRSVPAPRPGREGVPALSTPAERRSASRHLTRALPLWTGSMGDFPPCNPAHEAFAPPAPTTRSVPAPRPGRKAFRLSTPDQPFADWMRGNGVARCIANQGAISALTRPSATVASIPDTPAHGGHLGAYAAFGRGRLDPLRPRVMGVPAPDTPDQGAIGSLRDPILGTRAGASAPRHPRPAPCRAGLAAGARPLHPVP
jgi:hypothetical protein